MGAWGAGTFENDDALDWSELLYETRDLNFLRNTMQIVVEQKSYLEMSECCQALAAAEVVASAGGNKAPTLPSQADEWLDDKDLDEIRKLAPLAREVIIRIKTNSELKEAWDASSNSADWYGVINGIEARLT